MTDEALIRSLRKCIVLKDSAGPLYSKFLDQTLFFPGLDEAALKRIRSLVERMIKQSDHQKKILRETISRFEGDRRVYP